MSTGELVNLMFLAFVSAGLGVTFWRRLSEIRDELKDDIASVWQEMGGLRQELHDEMGGLRQELHDEMGGLRQELHDEIGGLRQELHDEIRGLGERMSSELGGLRQEMAIMRSDLTQVALAVGVRPRASND